MSKLLINGNIDWKKKVLMIVDPINLVLEVDEAGGFSINNEMLKIKEKETYDLFEDDLLSILSVEQEIKLYKCWGMALSVMISRTADSIGVDKRLAKQIIVLAEQYGLLYQGNNYSWKITNKDMKGRWLDKAKDKENQIKDPNTVVSRVPKTPQESLDRLAQMSTPEQKAKARGEVYIKGEGMISNTVKEEVESPVEVIDESKIYSPAAKAKAEERKRWEQDVKEGGKKAMQEMNAGGPKNLPKCITVLPSRDGQTLPKKNALPDKPTRR